MSNEEILLLIFVLKIENKCTFRFKKMYNSFWRLYMGATGGLSVHIGVG